MNAIPDLYIYTVLYIKTKNYITTQNYKQQISKFLVSYTIHYATSVSDSNNHIFHIFFLADFTIGFYIWNPIFSLSLYI